MVQCLTKHRIATTVLFIIVTTLMILLPARAPEPAWIPVLTGGRLPRFEENLAQPESGRPELRNA